VVFSEVSIKYSISSIPEPPESCLSTFSAILNLKEEENSDFLTPYKTDNEKKDTAQFVTSEKEFCDNFINSSDKIAEQ
jgi:hypothetical protein